MRVITSKLDDELPSSELKVLNALRSIDAPRAIALHSVVWQGVRSDRQADGEADFVILDGERGILVLEVKGGGIDVVAGRWQSRDRFGDIHAIKDPFQQAMASKHALLRYLKAVEPDVARDVKFGHAVAFPDVTCDVSWIGPASPRQIIVDRADLSDMGAALRRVFQHWGIESGPSSGQRGKLQTLLAPTLTIRRRLVDEVSDVEAALMELTADQVAAMDGVKRHRRLAILGGAGTGKTVLATERARQLAAEGNATLLTCFNKPLGHALSAQLAGSGVKVASFHALCVELFDRAKIGYPQPSDTRWWSEDAGSALVEACASLGTEFDAVLVDEAQDFESSWLDALNCLLRAREDSVYLVYGDSHQDLWGRSWASWLKVQGWSPFDLTTNCRNTLSIARHVARVFGDSVSAKGTEGSEPTLHPIKSDRALVDGVVELVDQILRAEGLHPRQLVVLASNRTIVSDLHSRFAGDVPFCDVGRKGIGVDSIHRFKGLEASVVVVAFGMETATGVADELRYVAFSRAKSVLHVFGPKEALR